MKHHDNPLNSHMRVSFLYSLAVILVVVTVSACGRIEPVLSQTNATSVSTATETIDSFMIPYTPNPEQRTAVAETTAVAQWERDLDATSASMPSAVPNMVFPTFVDEPTPTIRVGLYPHGAGDCIGEYNFLSFYVKDCWVRITNNVVTTIMSGGKSSDIERTKQGTNWGACWS